MLNYQRVTFGVIKILEIPILNGFFYGKLIEVARFLSVFLRHFSAHYKSPAGNVGRMVKKGNHPQMAIIISDW